MWFIMNTKASNRDGLPESFLAQFGEHVIGFLSGFDRLRFRATLRPLFQPGGLEIYLSSCRVLIKDFSSFAQQLTDRIKQGAYELFRKAEFGLMHVRVQTWFTFTVDICLNGRQWLAHQMDQAGIAYRQCDNCFVWVEDFVEAQKLLDGQLQSDWPALLQKLLILAHPLQAEITGAMRGLSYYWSASQTELATDIVFDDAQSLQRLYPHFLLHGIRSFQSPDVLRFLGKLPRVQKLGASYVGEWLICIAGHKSLKLPTTGTLSLSAASPAQIHCIRKPPVSASQCSITLGVTEPSIRSASRTTLFYRPSVKASSPSRDYAIAIYEPSFTNPPSILCCDAVTRPPSLASSPYCAPMDSYAKFPIHTATSFRQKVVALSPPF
jgi:hypothetical protein